MSTRSFIGQKNPDASVTGTYHHWDGYPDGVGKTLWGLYHGTEKGSERFKENLPLLLNVVLSHRWSTINSKDWSFEPAYVNDAKDGLCRTCHQTQFSSAGLWQHATYAVNGDGTPDLARRANAHEYNPPPEYYRPQCYCHQVGSRPFEPMPLSEASGMGAEYAYVFDPEQKTLAVMSSYIPEDADSRAAGQKMIGMFGYGFPDAEWHPLAFVRLDGDEPDWHNLEGDDEE